ncbi:transposase [Denitrificimonas halotolerans]
MHLVFLLNYHLILVSKYRRKVFDAAVSSRAKEIFDRIALHYKVVVSS